MRKKKRPITLEKVLSTCVWCGKRMPKDTEVFSLGAKIRSEVDLRDQEGQVLCLSLPPSNRTIYAIVPANDSAAKREGNDLIFMFCSQSCGQSLKAAVQEHLNSVSGRG